MELPQTFHYLCVSLIKKDTIMKTTTRYEVRYKGKLRYSTYNLFKAYEYYDNYTVFYGTTEHHTIHEITTTEKDITHTAKIEKPCTPSKK